MGAACACNESSETAGVEKVKIEKKAEGAPASAPVETLNNMPIEPPKNKLTLTIVGARGLRNADWLPGTGKSDSYCILKISGKEVYTTNIISDSLDPVWEEEFDVPEYKEGTALEFALFDKDVTTSESLGNVTMASEMFSSAGFNGEVKVQNAGRGQDAFLWVQIKLQGKHYPPGPAREVEIKVERKSKNTSFGLELDTQDKNTLVVLGLKDGVFKEYNLTVPPEMQLKKNDFIVSVNGAWGSSAALLDNFKNVEQVALKVIRPVCVTVFIDRVVVTDEYGLEFPKSPAGDSLVILSISEGVISKYNLSVKDESQKLLVGDRIISVGGRMGSSAQLKQWLEGSTGKFRVIAVRMAHEAAKGFHFFSG